MLENQHLTITEPIYLISALILKMGIPKNLPHECWKVFRSEEKCGFKLNQGTALSLLRVHRSSEGAY